MQEYTGAAYTPDETEFNVFNTDQKLAAVEGLANVLGGIPGRKAVVEFTGGITQTGEENRTQLRAATDAANRADVSIYSIDSRGLLAAPPGGDVTTNAATGTSMFTGASVFHQTDQREDSRDTLATLSTDTGGKAFFDLGDLSDAFPEDPAGQRRLLPDRLQPGCGSEARRPLASHSREGQCSRRARALSAMDTTRRAIFSIWKRKIAISSSPTR